MNESLFLGFLAATALLLVTPGPSCALATSQAIRYGPRAAVLTVVGDALGTVTHIVVATLGLQLLIGVASSVLPWLQILGGSYILYLAYQSSRVEAASINQEGSSTYEPLLSGFLACVTNPKAIIFFVALFPGFIDVQYDIALQSLIYGLVFIILDVISILFYTMAAIAVLRLPVLSSIRQNTLSSIGLLLVGGFLIGKGVLEASSAFG